MPAQVRPSLIAHSYVQDDGSVGVVALTLNKVQTLVVAMGCVKGLGADGARGYDR